MERAGFSGVKRVLLVNALIFAVLAAAIALAYYGYSYTSEASSRERELALMADLAEEKVLNIETLIDDADNKFLREVRLDPVSDLAKLKDATGAAAASVFVLDDQLRLVPGGYASIRSAKDGAAFSGYFMTRILPELQLEKQPLGICRHQYLRAAGQPGQPPGRWYLFSSMRRQSGDRTFHVVIEDDPSHLVGRLFPQFFAISNSKRLYQVVDELGEVVFGPPFVEMQGEPVVERRFTLTVEGWVLRVTQKDLGVEAAQRRKQLIDSLLIGGAITVIVFGLGWLGFAIRRERRLNELKSEFISNVSHELKTPITAIRAHLENLLDGVEQPDPKTLQVMLSQTERLGRLIEQLLELSRLESGELPLLREDTPLAPLVTREDEEPLERAAVLLVLADEITERTPPGVPAALDCRARGGEMSIRVPALPSWGVRGIGARFEAAFGWKLRVVPGARGRG